MKKEKKEVLFDDTNYFKEYGKTEYGKMFKFFLLIGVVTCLIAAGVLGGVIGDTIAIINGYCTNAPKTGLSWLFLVFLAAVSSGFLIGNYFGQVTHYRITKKK